MYGVLDKNYKKDDIVSKKRVHNDIGLRNNNTSLDVDDVRKKAFGTLEDELETTLNRIEVTKYDDQIEQSVSRKERETLETEAIKPKKEKIEDIFFNSNMTLEEAFSKYEMESDDDQIRILNDKTDLIESDLFNLIDSMYDKNDNKEA